MIEELPYAVWEATLEAIVGTGGTTLVLGGTDVGKTTFTRLLTNRAVEAGHRVAVIDADIGQSEIGPPTCVGLGFTETPVQSLSDLPAHALAFVGGISPQHYLPEHLTAVRRLADLVSDRLLIVDTGGYLHGAGARRLNQLTFDLLSPAHIVGLQRAGELEPILAPMRRRKPLQIHLPSIPAVIAKKPPAFRAQRRAMRFAAHFQNAQIHTYAFEEVALMGTWMGSGTPIAPHLLTFLNQALGRLTRVYYAELCDRHLGMMVSRPVLPNAQEVGLALESLGAREVSISLAPRLKHLLLGLESANGKLLGLGLLEALDFRRRTLGILTPVRTPGAACILRFGSLRIGPEGKEWGTIRPGEI